MFSAVLGGLLFIVVFLLLGLIGVTDKHVNDKFNELTVILLFTFLTLTRVVVKVVCRS